MAKSKQINLGELAISIALNTKAIQDGLNEVKVQLKKGSKDIQNHAKDYDKLAIVAGYAFTKVVGAIKEGVEAFNDYKNSMTGLKSISEGTGNSFSQAQKFIEEFTQDGLVPASNAATSLKNLLSRGFGMNEAADIMNRFKDSAAFGRQSALSLGEAVKSATEGLKNENSVLVDNAGVTKNVSVMWKEYAESIGKGVDSLTAAEKRQAEYNGIMKETQHQVGDAAKYAQEFSGAQAKTAAETLKLKQAIGGALVPVLNTLLNIITPIISFVTELIKQNPVLSSSIIAMIATITGLATAALTLYSALKLLKPAIKAITLEMAKNPVLLALIAALTVLVGVISAVTSQFQKAKKVQDEYNASVEKYNKIKKEGIEKSQVQQFEEEANKLEKLIDDYDKLTAKFNELKAMYGEGSTEGSLWSEAARLTGVDTRNMADEFKKLGLILDLTTGNIDEAKNKLAALRQEITKASFITSQEFNEQAKTIAQKKVAINQTQSLINAYKNAAKGSKEWSDAEQKLADQFPQFASASGIKITAIENLVTTQEKAAMAEFALMQTRARLQKIDVDNVIKSEETKVKAMAATIGAMMGEDQAMNALIGRQLQQFRTAREKLNALKDESKALGDLANIKIEDVQGVKPSGSTNYNSADTENKALNESLKLLEHKKRLNQLTLQEEIKTLEQIKAKYVKSADEKMDIEERLYDARKALNEKDLALQQEALKEKTKATLNWIEDKKTAGDLSLDQEIAAYDKLISEHKTYIDKISADTKIAADEKKSILADEAEAVREYEKKKYDIKKEYADKDREDTVNSIDRMNSVIISALRNRYQQQQELQERALQNELDDLDDWKDRSLDNINDVYDAKIKAIEDAARAQQKALQDEIDALDQGKKDKDRAEQDALELSKIQRIKDKIDYEHNEFNKAQLQKELNKLLEEREKRLYEQQLEDKKDSLEKQIDAVKENVDKQKELLEQQKEEEIERIKYLYDARKATLAQELEDVKQFYAEKLTQAQLQAEAEKMLMQSTQEEILELLRSYGDEYAITGKTLGDRLYDGFKPAIDNIKALISSITDSINSAREEALRVQVEASKIVIPVIPSASTGTNTAADSKKIEVNQQLVFNSPNLTPSETARKNKQASREMAMEWGLS